MVFKRHKILVTVIVTLCLAAAITAAIFITNGERDGSYRGTLVWTNDQEEAA
ncbi:MAG: hypothetical protein K0S61_2689 [Anaerocolumna sp.]|jgi:hypothetical protein|nr:hypothetical protein [Anaerocolumna sp.]